MWWVGWLWLLVAYLVIPCWLFVRHNKRRPIRQIFIFHPLADAGGGGEKCLWALLGTLVRREEDQSQNGMRRKPLRVNIFVHRFTPHIKALLAQVERNFAIKFPYLVDASGPVIESRSTTRLNRNVTLRIVRLSTASKLFENYPVATQLLQLLSGLLVGLEAALRTKGNRKDIIWDTTGLASTVATFSWTTCQFRRKSYCYVHWPFVSPRLRRGGSGLIHGSYGCLMRMLYSQQGRCFQSPVVVNSTFTKRGMKVCWPYKRLALVYPPVDFPQETQLDKSDTVISIAQFRPEKNHLLQLEAIALLLNKKQVPPHTRFLLCGSCRPGSTDLQLVLALLAQAESLLPLSAATLKVENHSEQKVPWSPAEGRTVKGPFIEFHLNLPSPLLRTLTQSAKVGIHTMKDEHFGIVVTELLLGGCFVVAHNSAGPRDDILRGADEGEAEALGLEADLVGKPLGVLAESAEEFADGIWRGLNEDESRLIELGQKVARHRFSTSEVFGERLLDMWTVKPTNKEA